MATATWDVLPLPNGASGFLLKSEYYIGCDKEFPLFDEGFTGPRLCKPCSIQYRKLDFEEFCVVAISLHQLEGTESWEQRARHDYELFEMDVNKPIMFEGTCLCILVLKTDRKVSLADIGVTLCCEII